MLTVVDGKVVYAAGHSPLAPPPIPVLPEWSPVKVPGHYRSAPPATAKIGAMVQMHQCCGSCGVHGHQHDIARKSSIPVSDEQAFWGVLGCSCLLIPETTAPAASGRWFQPRPGVNSAALSKSAMRRASSRVPAAVRAMTFADRSHRARCRRRNCFHLLAPAYIFSVLTLILAVPQAIARRISSSALRCRHAAPAEPSPARQWLSSR